MNRYLPLFLILMSFAEYGYSNQSDTGQLSDNRCSHYILSIHFLQFRSGPEQHVNIRTSDVFEESRVYPYLLRTMFEARNTQSGEASIVRDVEGRALHWEIGPTDPNQPIEFDLEAHSTLIRRVAQENVRNGLSQLSDMLQHEYHPWIGIVSDLTPEGQITIQKSNEDQFREGDIFRIFPIENSNSCDWRKNQPSIALARLTRSEDYTSILEVTIDQTNGQRSVQLGDIVEAAIDLSSSDDDKRRRSVRKSLQLGFLDSFAVPFYRDGERVFIEMAPFIEDAVRTEAPQFGFDYIE